MGSVWMLPQNQTWVDTWHYKSVSFIWEAAFPELKMINQCCIEFFTTSKKTYQAASLSKEMAITSILGSLWQEPAASIVVWMRVGVRQRFIWSLVCSESQHHCEFLLWFLQFCSLSFLLTACICCWWGLIYNNIHSCESLTFLCLRRWSRWCTNQKVDSSCPHVEVSLGKIHQHLHGSLLSSVCVGVCLWSAEKHHEGLEINAAIYHLKLVFGSCSLGRHILCVFSDQTSPLSGCYQCHHWH